MNRNRVEDFGPYQDALELFDRVVEDMAILQKDPQCYRLIGQQIGSADSIAANIDEGFGRISRTEYIRFLDISRGSARETLGRYKRMKHWLSQETIDKRVELSDRIIARLTKTIQTLKADNPTATRSPRHSTPDTRHSTPDTRHSTPDTQHSPLSTRHSTPDTGETP
jgi:four helix bundle protein